MFVGILATLLEMVQNEQSATGKHVESATRKKVQHENITTQKRAMVQYEKCATWKSCKIKKYELLQWSTRKVHKNMARITGRPLADRYTLVLFFTSTWATKCYPWPLLFLMITWFSEIILWITASSCFRKLKPFSSYSPDWVIADKSSDTFKMLLKIRSSHRTIFCKSKNDVL